MKRAYLAIGIALLLIGGFLYWHSATQNTDIAAEADARNTVIELGTRLKEVSLLAPDAKQELADRYGTLVTPELLAAWQDNPINAPGRTVSSPWPERIDILSSEQIGEKSYRIEGNVIEVTSAEVSNNGVASSYRATFTVTDANGAWRIASYDRGAAN